LSRSLPLTADEVSRWGLSFRVDVERARDEFLASFPKPDQNNNQQYVKLLLQDIGITGQKEFDLWMKTNHLSIEDVHSLALRNHHWFCFCEHRFSHKMPSYFLERKSELDQLSYFSASFQEEGLAHEYYFRINEGEVHFMELIDAPVKGVSSQVFDLAPVGSIPISVVKALKGALPTHVTPPLKSSDGWVILQLIDSKPALLDVNLRRRLLFELGSQFLLSHTSSLTSATSQQRRAS